MLLKCSALPPASGEGLLAVLAQQRHLDFLVAVALLEQSDNEPAHVYGRLALGIQHRVTVRAMDAILFSLYTP
jgi:hypothetical protein